MIDIFTFILEIIGTVAFSVSGAMVAIEKKMDILGVVILGLTTAVGGGITRDIIIGNTPPQAFVNPVYAIVAVLTAIAVFLPGTRRIADRHSKSVDTVIFFMDSAGLGIFTVVGIATTQTALPDCSLFLLVFVGTLTGVGGGVLRDVMAGNTPYIFVKHFYACASIIGALVCCLLWDSVPNVIAMSAGTFVILILRIFAARFHWKLPKAE